jgi:lambda family phage tail tape measure protein
MATVDQYKIRLSVEGQQAVDTLKNSISGLGSSLAGIGFAAFITSAFKMADAMDDVAKATGLTIGYVTALSQSIEQAGGNFDDAGKIITTFFNTLDQAAQGSEKAQDALAKVGIQLSDLSRLSEQELLQKAINNLSEMQAGAGRTALAVDVFGKAIKNVDPKSLEEALATKDITKLQDEMKKAADVVDNLQSSFRELQMAAIRLLTPIIGDVENFKLTAEQAEKVVKTLGIAIGVAFAVSKAAQIIEIVTAVVSLTKALQAAEIASMGVGSKLGMLTKLGIGATALLYSSDLNSNEDAELAKRRAGTPAHLMNQPGAAPAKPASSAPSKAAYDASQVSKYTKEELDARLKAGVAAQQQTKQLTLQNTEAQKYLRTVIATMGQDEIAGNLKRDLVQMESDAKIKIADLTKQIAVEETNRRGPNQEVVNQLKAQVVEVNKNFEATKKLKEQEAAKLSLLEQQRLTMTRNLEALQTMARIEGELVKEQMKSVVIYGVGTEEQMKQTIEFAGLQREHAVKITELKLRLSKEENENVKKDLEARIKLEELYYQKNGELLEIKYKNEKLLQQSGIAGARAAYEAIAQSMTPYMMAQNQVNALWGSMTSAIDNFVDHGKFSFSDFATSVIKDLLKIQLKAAAVNLMGMMGAGGGGGGGGGFWSSVGSILGFANGGSPPVGKPSIVGEKGPELFVPKTAGTVIPNGASGGSQIVNNYNISAIDSKSVAQLFAENRRLLLGSVRAAEKELPYRAR